MSRKKILNKRFSTLNFSVIVIILFLSFLSQQSFFVEKIILSITSSKDNIKAFFVRMGEDGGEVQKILKEEQNTNIIDLNKKDKNYFIADTKNIFSNQ